jgi:hypothetical protein
MRSLVFSLALVLATASVAQSQQALSSSPVSEPTAQAQQAVVPVAAPTADVRADAPVGLTRSDAVLKPVRADRPARANAAAMDPTARNMFAIVGVVVVIIALVALLS